MRYVLTGEVRYRANDRVKWSAWDEDASMYFTNLADAKKELKLWRQGDVDLSTPTRQERSTLYRITKLKA